MNLTTEQLDQVLSSYGRREVSALVSEVRYQRALLTHTHNVLLALMSEVHRNVASRDRVLSTLHVAADAILPILP